MPTAQHVPGGVILGVNGQCFIHFNLNFFWQPDLFFSPCIQSNPTDGNTEKKMPFGPARINFHSFSRIFIGLLIMQSTFFFIRQLFSHIHISSGQLPCRFVIFWICFKRFLIELQGCLVIKFLVSCVPFCTISRGTAIAGMKGTIDCNKKH